MATALEHNETESSEEKEDSYSAPRPPPINPTEEWLSWLPSWKPTSEESLIQAEKIVLSSVTSKYTDRFIPIADNKYIRTLSIATDNPHPNLPLVMVHGFGCGLGCFYKNFDHLHSKRNLHAFDVLGFARSSRSSFGNEPDVVEAEFVESFEKWRQEMGIEKMILLGHSLGAFMCTSYAMKYPERVRHLILVDAWGFLEEPEEINTNGRARRYKFLIPVLKAYFKVFNPFSMIRGLGPAGRSAIARFRPDLQEKFGEQFMDYVYHCNAQEPSGESAFFHMQSNLTYAKRPMVNRLQDLSPTLPMSMLFGTKSWFSSSSGEVVYEERPHSFVDIHYIEDAGHHIHADLPDVFNRVVNDICELTDNNGDVIVNGAEGRIKEMAFHCHSS